MKNLVKCSTCGTESDKQEYGAPCSCCTDGVMRPKNMVGAVLFVRRCSICGLINEPGIVEGRRMCTCPWK